MLWRVEPLPTHPNGMRFTAYDAEGTMLATNEYFSVGGGFVVNERTQVDENLYFRSINKEDASEARRDQAHGLGNKALPSLTDGTDSSSAESKSTSQPKPEKSGQPPFLFRNAAGLLAMTKKHNVRLLL